MTKLRDVDPYDVDITRPKLWRWFWISLVIIVVIIFGGWQLGWWFTAHNVSRGARVYQRSYGRQTSLREDISTKIGTVTDITVQLADPSVKGAQAEALRAQRLAVARVVCQDAASLNSVGDLPPDQQEFIGRNCSAGDVSAGSEYRK